MKRLPDVMSWLRAGIPVSLFVDLMDPQGPASLEIYQAEPTDLDWTVGIRAA